MKRDSRTQPANTRSVKIKDVQAIRELQFDMPEDDGGVIILTGTGGVGKTTAIQCLASLLGESVTLRPNENADSGTIEGLGVTQTVRKVKRSSGTTDVPNLIGRFSFSDLVEPPVKAKEARTKTRVRALASLANLKAEPADFYEVFGGREQFATYVSPDALRIGSDGAELLELADAIKAAAESSARAHEQEAETLNIEYQALEPKAAQGDPDQPPPSVRDLAERHSQLSAKAEQLKSQVKDRQSALDINRQVDEKLSALVKPNIDTGLASKIVGVQEHLEALKQQLLAAESELAALQAEQTKQNEAEEAYQNSVHQLSELRTEVGPEISETDIASAERSAHEAYEALANAEEAKTAYEAAVRNSEIYPKIECYWEEAARCREGAKAVASVVTEKLPGDDIQFVGGELVSKVPRRKHAIPLDEMSEGQRWKLAIQVAIKYLQHGVMPVRQEAWQSLPYKVQCEVAKACKEAKIWMVTAQVTDGDLGVSKMQG